MYQRDSRLWSVMYQRDFKFNSPLFTHVYRSGVCKHLEVILVVVRRPSATWPHVMQAKSTISTSCYGSEIYPLSPDPIVDSSIETLMTQVGKKLNDILYSILF